MKVSVSNNNNNATTVKPSAVKGQEDEKAGKTVKNDGKTTTNEAAAATATKDNNNDELFEDVLEGITKMVIDHNEWIQAKNTAKYNNKTVTSEASMGSSNSFALLSDNDEMEIEFYDNDDPTNNDNKQETMVTEEQKKRKANDTSTTRAPKCKGTKAAPKEYKKMTEEYIQIEIDADNKRSIYKLIPTVMRQFKKMKKQGKR